MQQPTRLSRAALLILRSVLEGPDDGRCGAEIMRATHLPSGTLYPILLRFERGGILASQWESEEPAEIGRPRRRIYRLTPSGLAFAREALAELVPVAALGFPVRRAEA